MKNNSGRGRCIPIALLVFAVIGSLVGAWGFIYWAYINQPALTFEDYNYPLEKGKSLVCITVRNEGCASADDVEINVNSNGEIGNIWVRKGVIIEKELFKEPANIEKEMSSCAVRIDYVPQGMKYVMGLIINEPDSYELTYQTNVNSRNGGIAERYIHKSRWVYGSAITGFVAGVISGIATVFLYRRIHSVKQR